VEISTSEKVGDSGIALRFGDKSKLKNLPFGTFLRKLRAGDDGNNYYLNIQEVRIANALENVVKQSQK
jgi:hypothetical protein